MACSVAFDLCQSHRMCAPVPSATSHQRRVDELRRRATRSAIGHEQNGMIAPPDPSGTIGRREQGIHLRARRGTSPSADVALARHRQDSLAMEQTGQVHSSPRTGRRNGSPRGAYCDCARCCGDVFDMGKKVARTRHPVFDRELCRQLPRCSLAKRNNSRNVSR